MTSGTAVFAAMPTSCHASQLAATTRVREPRRQLWATASMYALAAK
jgi:hypothetical protein